MIRADSFDSRSIPFGISVETGEMVEIGNAQRGRACQCVCPSCEQPLQACQGEINDWHFKHDSQLGSNKEQPVCEFSLWPTLRKFAIQAAVNGHLTTLKTPSKSLSLGIYTKTVATSGSHEVQYTKGEWSDLVASFSGSEHRVHINFIYPGRHGESGSPQADGVLEVSLTAVFDCMESESLQKDAFSNAVCKLLGETHEFKWWKFHPREPLVKKALEELVHSAALDDSNNLQPVRHPASAAPYSQNQNDGRTGAQSIPPVRPSSSAIRSRSFLSEALDRVGESNTYFTAIAPPTLKDSFTLIQLSGHNGVTRLTTVEGTLFSTDPNVKSVIVRSRTDQCLSGLGGAIFFELRAGPFREGDIATYCYKAAFGELGVKLSPVGFQSCYFGSDHSFACKKARALFSNNLCQGLFSIGAASRIFAD